MLTFIGGTLLTAIGFLVGRAYTESERILSERRKTYAEVLSILPSVRQAGLDEDGTKFNERLRLIIEQHPKMLLYADLSVLEAWFPLFNKYMKIYLTMKSPSTIGSEELLVLLKSVDQDLSVLVYQMRRDVYRFSFFRHRNLSHEDMRGLGSN